MPTSPEAASVLALIAENPGIQRQRFEDLLFFVSDPNDRTVARLLTHGKFSITNGAHVSQYQMDRVAALQEWVRGNRSRTTQKDGRYEA